MFKKLGVAAAMLVAVALGPAVPTGVAQGTDLSVTVSYTGKGPVDDKNDILVFLFREATPTPTSQPISVQYITKNGGTAVFKGVTGQVYVVSVYDEKANYDGQSGPPPTGHPIGGYAKDGKPVQVDPAKTPKITFKFDDSRRWP
jgi:hypothetical protein